MTGVELLHITTDDESYKLTGDTVVIGGGNVAIDVSRTAIRCGSPKVSQVLLRQETLCQHFQKKLRLLNQKVSILLVAGDLKKSLQKMARLQASYLRNVLR